MPSENVYYYRPDKPIGSWTKYLIVSLVLHFFVAALIFVAPSGSSDKKHALRPQAIDVRLVSLNPDLPTPRPRNSAPAPRTVADGKKLPDSSKTAAVETAPEQEPIPVKSAIRKKITKDYVLKTPEPAAPKAKESLKKKTIETEKVIASAVRRIEEKAESKRPQSVQERIEQMKGEVDDLAYNKERLDAGEGKASGGNTAAQDYSQLNVWQAEVQVEMKQNWAFSSELAGDTQGLESRLLIKIMPDGQITDVWFEKRSGNPYLDESAYKTVMKSNPLPPLPESYPYYHLVLGFTPSGMK